VVGVWVVVLCGSVVRDLFGRWTFDGLLGPWRCACTALETWRCASGPAGRGPSSVDLGNLALRCAARLVLRSGGLRPSGLGNLALRCASGPAARGPSAIRPWKPCAARRVLRPGGLRPANLGNLALRAWVKGATAAQGVRGTERGGSGFRGGRRFRGWIVFVPLACVVARREPSRSGQVNSGPSPRAGAWRFVWPEWTWPDRDGWTSPPPQARGTKPEDRFGVSAAPSSGPPPPVWSGLYPAVGAGRVGRLWGVPPGVGFAVGAVTGRGRWGKWLDSVFPLRSHGVDIWCRGYASGPEPRPVAGCGATMPLTWVCAAPSTVGRLRHPGRDTPECVMIFMAVTDQPKSC
jgi:hypothetical protein